MSKKPTAPTQERASLRTTISEITEQLIQELHQEDLTPADKIALLRVLLPYSVGKLPTALVNYSVYSGQPTSARVIDLSEDGGISSGCFRIK